jgi:hypothetical protein
VLSALVDAQRPASSDLVDVTEGELAAIVAAYLRSQEGLDVRILRAPPLDDPAWSRIATGPRGELYDLDRLARACHRLVAADGRSPGLKDDPSGLRALCLARGIDLPLRALTPIEHARTVAAALVTAARARSARRLALWTTLGKDADDAVGVQPELVRAARFVRARRHRLSVQVPVLASADPADVTAALVARVDRARAARAVATLVRLGFAAMVADGADPSSELPSGAPARRPPHFVFDLARRLP